jgi:hypothetical protein
LQFPPFATVAPLVCQFPILYPKNTYIHIFVLFSGRERMNERIFRDMDYFGELEFGILLILDSVMSLALDSRGSASCSFLS